MCVDFFLRVLPIRLSTYKKILIHTKRRDWKKLEEVEGMTIVGDPS
jgi:hypothetical protein